MEGQRKTVQHTVRGYQLGGLFIPLVDVEPCERLVQIGKGQPITCTCSRCKARLQVKS